MGNGIKENPIRFVLAMLVGGAGACGQAFIRSGDEFANIGRLAGGADNAVWSTSNMWDDFGGSATILDDFGGSTTFNYGSYGNLTGSSSIYDDWARAAVWGDEVTRVNSFSEIWSVRMVDSADDALALGDMEQAVTLLQSTRIVYGDTPAVDFRLVYAQMDEGLQASVLAAAGDDVFSASQLFTDIDALNDTLRAAGTNVGVHLTESGDLALHTVLDNNWQQFGRVLSADELADVPLETVYVPREGRWAEALTELRDGLIEEGTMHIIEYIIEGDDDGELAYLYDDDGQRYDLYLPAGMVSYSLADLNSLPTQLSTVHERRVHILLPQADEQ